MKAARILIVDDEAIARENLGHILGKEGYETVAVENGLQALKKLQTDEFDLILTDLKMEKLDGIELLERSKSLCPHTEVILITGYATVSSAVAAMQKGAYHYLAKPFNLNEVRILVKKALEKRILQQEVVELRRQLESHQGIEFIIGKSPSIVELKKNIQQIAPADCSVLIHGETGTGKELVAKAIHRLSPRAAQRFLALNCGAFNEELLANELFGHEKEAFSGAHRGKIGLLEAASGGTVLLDEIAEMPSSMQIKLLRVLQEKRLIKVGGNQEIPVDIRVLAATNKDLKQEVRQGRFRQDVYYRLNVINLHVSPLAERKDDIPLLCRHFIEKFSQAQGKKIEAIPDQVMDILMDYEFPGNVRELENIIERAVTLAQGSTIEVSHLPADLQQTNLRVQRKGAKEFPTLEENEKEYILWVLKKLQGNKTKAAEILGIDRVSLWRKIKKFGIEET